MMDKDIEFMKEALKEAELAGKEDEVPSGCVIVKDDQIIARGHNQRDKSHNPLGHAETLAIKAASEVVIKRVVYGAPDIKGGAFGSSINILEASNINHRPEVTKGILEEECASIIKNYFKSKRN